MKQVKIEEVYKELPGKHEYARSILGKPLTLAEKILWSHLQDAKQGPLERGKSFVLLRPDRVAMQDATAQMAILQFMQADKKTVAVPTTVHCDHLIQAFKGASADLETANHTNQEVYDFLSSAAKKYGMGFWKPGSGIIHQIVLENYAFPGGLMLGTDSHTPNAGGMGMLAIGVGGADAVDVMVGMPWEVLYPKIIGVKLTGKLNGWSSGKDIILKMLEILTVKGGTNCIVEYFGPGVESLSCTAQATVTNMGAELGATCSVFYYHDAIGRYLRATRRKDIADLADQYKPYLVPDPEVVQSPEKHYDQVIEIDLTALEPYVVGPHSPDAARPISKLKAESIEKKFPQDITAALIGSCTNSSYEDIGRSSSILKQGIDKGLKAKSNLVVSPGSDQVYATSKRDGFVKILDDAGATVMTNACGPCIGQWKRTDIEKGTSNSIISSFNRNFPARNDGNRETLSFISSPEIVAALALAGRLDFNPLTDDLKDSSGNSFKLSAPKGEELPSSGYEFDDKGFEEPAEDGSSIEVKVSPESERLQILSAFEKWDGKDFLELPLLAKAKGKCTTDHISPAGPWLKFRGHLDNISNNMLTGAINAFTGEPGQGQNLLTGQTQSFPDIARHYKANSLRWVIVGDENYGEGSSREHAAMCPRHLGVAAVITKSIARIHETNLKKQGALPLRFVDVSDYDKVQEQDKISITGLSDFAPGKNLKVTLHHKDGGTDSFEVSHSFNQEQIEWFKAGSALNLVA